MPEAKTNAGDGNKQGAFKDKDKPTEIRMSNITAAKGEYFCLWFNIYNRRIYKRYILRS